MRRLPMLTLILASPALAQEPPPPGENLLPLTIGNVWTYRVSGQDDRFVIRAVRQEMVGEQKCTLLEGSLKGNVVATEHVAFNKLGLYRFRQDTEDVVPPICVLRVPLPRSGRWGSSKNDKSEYRLGSRTITAGFTAKSEEIAVLGTKYKTTLIQAIANEGRGWLLTSDTWYSEGVGVVRQSILEGKRPPLVLELEKFEKGEGK